jgi:uncharacterized membrane protein
MESLVTKPRLGPVIFSLLLTLLILAVSPFSNACLESPSACRASDTTDGGRDDRAGAIVDEEFVVGKVRAVTTASVDQELLRKTGMVSRHQMAEVEVLEGRFRGSTFITPNEITDNPAYNVTVKPGQEVILCIVTTNGGSPEVNISDYRREHVLLWLLVAFLVAFLVFGGKQGLKALTGLVVCIGLISFVLLPLSLKGVNPLFTATLICFGSTVATMLFSAGFSRKAIAGIVGTVGGVLVAGVSAQVVIQAGPLIGLASEEAQILRSSMIAQPLSFYSGLLAAGMLIGALGVIMDVGISIASSVWEVSRTDRNLSVKALYQSGMNVGRDIMGTMTTTLVLAYTGSALPLLLLAAQMPSTKLLNLDLVATEICAALTGSLGLVCTIPLTAFVSARLMARRQRPKPTINQPMDDASKEEGSGARSELSRTGSSEKV